MDKIEFHMTEYREAVRMHLWFKGSPYSFQQGKASKDRAETYLRLAHHHHAERAKLLKQRESM